MDSAILTVNSISKSYGELEAVRELSFTANPGEVIALLGPNGAGKTTAIRMLTTILTPTSGDFSIGGIPQTRPDDIRRIIGVLPESAGYPSHLTGAEYLTYYGRLIGKSGPDARAAATSLLADVGLGDRSASRIDTYSRGMRQRLGVARAMVNSPRLIFLDEPTMGLDPAGQRQIIRLILELATQRGVTVLICTHLLNEAETVCNRALILNHGVTIASGTVDEVKRQAASPLTGSFKIPQGKNEVAIQALAQSPGVTDASFINGDRGVVTATFDYAWLDQHGPDGMNPAIQSLIDAEIPIISFEPEGDRLEDAFLALTGERIQ